MKRIIIIAGIVVVLGLVVFSVLKGRDQAEATVESGRIRTADLTSVVSSSGTIQPKRKVDVSANAMGTIVHLAVAEGQRVAQGDLLMEIDPSEYAAQVQALEASIASAEADLRLSQASLDKALSDRDRTGKLFDEGLVTEEQVVTARTNARVEQARVEAARHRITQYRANLSKARHDLDKVTISAPMAGVITRLNVEEGENAIMGTLNNPGTVLLVIADLGTMEAWVEVDETEVVKVELGQEASITIDAFPDEDFVGHVTEIGNSPIRSRTGSSGEAVDFEVKITLDQAPANIRPGLSAKAEVTVADRPQVLAVPLGAVTVRDWPLKATDIRRYKGRRARAQAASLEDLGFEPRPAAPDSATVEIEREETEGVFVLRDGYVKFVPVELGIAGENDFEILSGLEADETVVTGPFRILRELKDGALVKTSKKDRGRRGRDGSDES
ncbi:MAG: efflux RND transporter periplasmic adaptor subunit [bacterium]|nr:efflux RND transporter periplasmic adaptor subunit [bacterium]